MYRSVLLLRPKNKLEKEEKEAARNEKVIRTSGIVVFIPINIHTYKLRIISSINGLWNLPQTNNIQNMFAHMDMT